MQIMYSVSAPATLSYAGLVSAVSPALLYSSSWTSMVCPGNSNRNHVHSGCSCKNPSSSSVVALSRFVLPIKSEIKFKDLRLGFRVSLLLVSNLKLSFLNLVGEITIFSPKALGHQTLMAVKRTQQRMRNNHFIRMHVRRSKAGLFLVCFTWWV